MLTHRQIASGTDRQQKLADLTGKSLHTIRSWALRDSIPAEDWKAIAEAQIASLDELAAAAAASPRKRGETQQAAA